VASKFTSDIFYANSRYAKVGGIPLRELNQLELEFLFLIDFQLHVKLEDLQEYADQLLSHAMLLPNPIILEEKPQQQKEHLINNNNNNTSIISPHTIHHSHQHQQLLMPLTPPYNPSTTTNTEEQQDKKTSKKVPYHPYQRPPQKKTKRLGLVSPKDD
jgi:hypothetical protein